MVLAARAVRDDLLAVEAIFLLAVAFVVVFLLFEAVDFFLLLLLLTVFFFFRSLPFAESDFCADVAFV